MSGCADENPTGLDRHLVEVAFPNGMRLTVVREDGYDAVTVWSEDGESISTQAEVQGHLASLAPTRDASQSRAEDRIREIAALFNVPDGGRYLEDWKAKAAALRQSPSVEEVAQAIRDHVFGERVGPGEGWVELREVEQAAQAIDTLYKRGG